MSNPRPFSWLGATFLVLSPVACVIAALWFLNVMPHAQPLIRFEPAVVYAPLRLAGALVRGAAANWAVNRTTPVRVGDPVPVVLSAYCLTGTTRRDHQVREGIVASDPRMFPLTRYIEIVVGRTDYGRFLIDDTGRKIKGNRLDIWTPSCPSARRFGLRRGTAVLVPRPRGAAKDTLTTGRLGGRARRGGKSTEP